MSNHPRVLLVGADRATLDRALASGLDVVSLQTPARFDDVHAKCSIASVVIDYEGDQFVPNMLQSLAEYFNVKCVVSLTELGLLVASKLNEALGLPGLTPSVIDRSRDKIAMRDYLKDSLPVPASVVTDAAALVSFGDQHGWPIIVKPTDGAGSHGVCRIDGPEALVDWPFAKGNFIVEKYLEGRLFSAEGFSQAGKHIIYGVNEEFPLHGEGPEGSNPYLECGHQMPASLTPAQYAQVTWMVERVLTELGINEGPSHTEIILTDKGPFLLETHTRVGGDFIPEMVQRCTGIDLLSLAVGCPAGIMQPPPAPIWTRGAAIRYFTPPPGRVIRIAGVEAWRDHPGIAMIQLDLRPGDIVAPITASHDRVGFVMAICETSEMALSLCKQAVAAIEIEVAPSGSSATARSISYEAHGKAK
jgi:biotin carboxylase